MRNVCMMKFHETIISADHQKKVYFRFLYRVDCVSGRSQSSNHSMEVISAMIAQDAIGVATLITMPAVPRKKCAKLEDLTKDNGKLMICNIYLYEASSTGTITCHTNSLLREYQLAPPFLLGSSCLNWSGFISKSMFGKHPGKAIKFFHSALELTPNDMTCVTVCEESGNTAC